MSAGETGVRPEGDVRRPEGPLPANGQPAPEAVPGWTPSQGAAAAPVAPAVPAPAVPAPPAPVAPRPAAQPDGPSAEPLPLAAERPGSAHVAPRVGEAAAEQPAVARTRRSLQTWSAQRLFAVSTALVLLFVLTAYLASSTQPTVYGAQADLLFKVPGSSQEAERQLATQQVLLSSRGVLAPVAERFDVLLPTLAASQQVELLAGSEILRLQVRNEDADIAVRLTQAIADSYIESVSTTLGDAGSEQERQLRDQIADLSVAAAAGRTRLDEIASLRAAGDGTPEASSEERRLQVEDTTLTQRISTLQAQLTELLIRNASGRPAEILTPAYLLDEPVGPKPVRAAAAGAMVGLLLAGGLLALALRGRSFFAWP